MTDHPWSYRNSAGTLGWLSDAHEAVVLKRIVKIGMANEQVGVAMRYCQWCEVGVGTMAYEEFFDISRCPICGRQL